MPRYFFNIKNHVDSKDFVGAELADLETAKDEARKDIIDIMGSRSNTLGNRWPEWSIEICDHKGVLLFVVPFSSN